MAFLFALLLLVDNFGGTGDFWFQGVFVDVYPYLGK